MKKQIELLNYVMYDYDGPNPERERNQKQKIYKELLEYERQQKKLLEMNLGGSRETEHLQNISKIQIAVDKSQIDGGNTYFKIHS